MALQEMNMNEIDQVSGGDIVSGGFGVGLAGSMAAGMAFGPLGSLAAGAAFAGGFAAATFVRKILP